jgi:predicted negative regulator of RcsB-dependent stress response
MATPLDLQEQEQLDELKAFWKTWGNLITWVLIAAMAAYGAWSGWQWYQRDQGVKAAAMFDELDRAVSAGDAERAARVFGDLRSRYAATAWAAQGGLATAKLQFEKGQADGARASLAWVAEQAGQDELRAVARLRLAALDLEAKKYAEALAHLDAIKVDAFQALAADRRGDVLASQGKLTEAKTAYQAAYAAMGDKADFRRIVEAKLTALGAAPPAAPASEAAK